MVLRDAGARRPASPPPYTPSERDGLQPGGAIALPPPRSARYARIESVCAPPIADWMVRLAFLQPVLRDRQGHVTIELLCGHSYAIAHLLPRRPSPFRRR
jgi:hypothetical protein